MTESLDKLKKATPFLRWTGSKRWFVKDHIENFLPRNFSNYHEPFLGAGAVFFWLKDDSERHYFLTDSNTELINVYKQLKEFPKELICHLKTFKNSEDNYYKIRKLSPRSDSKKAARFIYLNRTSFNGIYRVNDKGKYNVPYGKRENVEIVTLDSFNSVNTCLQDVTLDSLDFFETLDNINRNDFVFIDPPYTVAHEKNGFIEYNQKLFSWEDQLRLKEYIERIIEIGAFFILTNACHQSIYDLYKDLAQIEKVSRYSQVGGRKKTRGQYNEYVIYNT